MGPHAALALKDYNDNVRTLQQAARESDLSTYASVVNCGVGYEARVELDTSRVNVLTLPVLERYRADGTRTPLWDSVNRIIDDLQQAADPEGVYLVMVTTDGLENASRMSGSALRKRIGSLQATDRWSFTFRVPRGYRRPLVSALDVAEGNVLEWEQTAAGFARATEAQGVAISTYYSTLRSGSTQTTRFYANLDHLTSQDLKAQLRDIANRVSILEVGHGRPTIKDFCESALRTPYIRGLAFYQVVKPETVQDHKEIIIRDKRSGAIYSGATARDVLRLPRFGAIRLLPGRYGDYELYVQSTSVNRILPSGSKVLYLTQAV